MNVLLLGKADSVFTRDFCRYILDSDEMNTVILSQELSEEYKHDYEMEGVRQIRWPDGFLKGVLKRPKTLLNFCKTCRELEKEIGFGREIDIMHVHYVEPLHLIYFLQFWKNAKKRILTFWGSDILRASRTKKILLPYFLKDANHIIFMIKNQYEFFQSIYGHKYDHKVRIIDFGNSLIDHLDKNLECRSREECKRYFDMPVDKIIVHVGYNAFRAQQHLEMMERLKELPEEILIKTEFVFSVAYRQDSDFERYKSQLIDIMDRKKVNYRFCCDYLQDEKLAMFRRTCDIFVYGQKTDARSESPLEYVYAGAEFICPRWLSGNYEILDRAETKYYIYENFEELCRVFESCLQSMDVSCDRINNFGRQKIREEISWDSVEEKWGALYEGQ